MDGDERQPGNRTTKRSATSVAMVKASLILCWNMILLVGAAYVNDALNSDTYALQLSRASIEDDGTYRRFADRLLCSVP